MWQFIHSYITTQYATDETLDKYRSIEVLWKLCKNSICIFSKYLLIQNAEKL